MSVNCQAYTVKRWKLISKIQFKFVALVWCDSKPTKAVKGGRQLAIAAFLIYVHLCK